MGKSGITTDDVKIEQKPNKNIPDLGEELEMEPDIVKPAGGYTPKQDKQYMADLEFLEEPVTIVINPSGMSRDAAQITDYVSVNGIPAEILGPNGRWQRWGWLPKGQPFVTKRKYLDVLLHAKEDAVKTQMNRLNDGQIMNEIQRTTFAIHSVTLIDDKNPNGREWFARRVAQNF